MLAILPCGCLVEVVIIDGDTVLGFAACDAADNCEHLRSVRVHCAHDFGITRAIIYV